MAKLVLESWQEKNTIKIFIPFTHGLSAKYMESYVTCPFVMVGY